MSEQGQSKKMSAMESITNVVVGYTLNIAVQYFTFFLVFGIHVTLKENITVGIIFTVVSLVRSYILRRVFNKYGRG